MTFLLCSAHFAKLDGLVLVGLLQDHRRRHRTDRGKSPKASIARRVVVPEGHGRGSGVHRLRSQQPRRTHPRQVHGSLY